MLDKIGLETKTTDISQNKGHCFNAAGLLLQCFASLKAGAKIQKLKNAGRTCLILQASMIQKSKSADAVNQRARMTLAQLKSLTGGPANLRYPCSNDISDICFSKRKTSHCKGDSVPSCFTATY